MKKIFTFILVSIAMLAFSHAEMKLGLQTYTFRKNSLVETFKIAQNLGLKYLQVYPGQELGAPFEGKMGPGMDQKTRDAVWELAKAHGLEIVSFGVTGPKDEASWRALLAFAKERGIKEIESEPSVEMLPILERLTKEYGVRVGAHNHPKGSAYSDAEQGLAVIKPYEGSNLGLAPDVGHWQRAGFDAVARLKAAKGLFQTLHFKDLNVKGPVAYDVPWGTGASDAKAILAELRKQGYNGYVFIEYEKLGPDLYDNVAKSVDWFNRALKADLADLEAGKVFPPSEVPASLAKKADTPFNPASK